MWAMLYIHGLHFNIIYLRKIQVNIFQDSEHALVIQILIPAVLQKRLLVDYENIVLNKVGIVLFV